MLSLDLISVNAEWIAILIQLMTDKAYLPYGFIKYIFVCKIESKSKPKAFEDLGELSKALMDKNWKSQPSPSLSLNEISIKPNNELTDELSNLFVPLESIKPAIEIPPMELFNKNNIKIVLHLAANSPAPNVHVAVISVTSNDTNNQLKNFLFQAAVTKVFIHFIIILI